MTPEDATDVLAALTAVENETEQARYSAAVEAEAQRVLEEEERRAGIPEARFAAHSSSRVAVKTTVAMLLATKRQPQGLYEPGYYSKAYGPLDSDPELMAVATFYDAVE